MNPLRDLLERAHNELNRRYRQAVCKAAGHRPSWTLAVALGITDAPVCERCDQELHP